MITQEWSIEPKKWESEFFGKDICSLKIGSYDINYIEFVKFINQSKFDILEFNLPITDIDQAYKFEKVGFQLVDSRITFITKFEKEKWLNEIPRPENISLRTFVENDIPTIEALTNEFLHNSRSFKSRYQNLYFFNPGDSERYFKQWIKNTITDSNSIISVAVNRHDTVVAYFIYQKKGDYNSLPLYKGILCSVTKKYQGLKLHLLLQNHIFKLIQQQVFYIDNTTQLSNLPIIKNHIRSKRNLISSFLTFMMRKDDLIIIK